MSDNPNFNNSGPQLEFLNQWQENSQKIMQKMLEATQVMATGNFNPVGQMEQSTNVMEEWLKIWGAVATKPDILAKAQQEWFNALPTLMGGGAGAVQDRRFKDKLWDEYPQYGYLRDAYLKLCDVVVATIQNSDIPADEKEKTLFNTKQFLDTIAPSNFLMTNPQALKEFYDSKGESLVKGMENFVHDLNRGNGQLRISQTDESKFEVGVNLAVTPGVVAYRNNMFELLQYTPSTPKVGALPLLITPPWINKFYILDMQESNSFIKWAVDSGLTVFVISWINPNEKHRDIQFDDYVEHGVMAAINQVLRITNQKQCNAIGYCIGGTLLATTLAIMANQKANQKDNQVASATFFTTMLDFAEPGELKFFINEEQIEQIESQMSKFGYLDGKDMAQTFSSLRANDLIWSFYVNNYLMGREPKAFDLLYWNGDSTRMPCKMHSFYLRNMYLNNKLKDKNGISVLGNPIDLGKINLPTCFISTKEDHIAPWISTYNGATLLGGKKNKFILAGSGHIAGIINPPAGKKYNYWVNESLPQSHDEWLQNAQSFEGSWWPHWREWLNQHNGGEVPARKVEDIGLGTAPGSYVKVRY